MKIYFKNKSFDIKAKECNGFRKFIGLMFKSRETESLLFDFDEENRYSIHSLFVFFPFLAIWMDKNNEVIEYRIVSPFSINIYPKNKFRKIVEIPINSKNIWIVRFFVGKTEKFK